MHYEYWTHRKHKNIGMVLLFLMQLVIRAMPVVKIHFH